jgi:large repetitive protein
MTDDGTVTASIAAAVAADGGGATNKASTSSDSSVTFDGTAPTLTINTIAVDDIINATEDDSDVTISGTTSGAEDGQTVTVGLNSKTYTDNVSTNTWSVTVPAADAQALDASETVTADVSDLSGNTSNKRYNS